MGGSLEATPTDRKEADVRELIIDNFSMEEA